jgi:hypothetical protein
MDTATKETNHQALERIAHTNLSDERDSLIIADILRRTGFPNVVVTCGIVYLEGRGTITTPPASIHGIAKMLLKIIKEQEKN